MLGHIFLDPQLCLIWLQWLADHLFLRSAFYWICPMKIIARITIQQKSPLPCKKKTTDQNKRIPSVSFFQSNISYWCKLQFLSTLVECYGFRSFYYQVLALTPFCRFQLQSSTLWPSLAVFLEWGGGSEITLAVCLWVMTADGFMYAGQFDKE